MKKKILSPVETKETVRAQKVYFYLTAKNTLAIAMQLCAKYLNYNQLLVQAIFIRLLKTKKSSKLSWK